MATLLCDSCARRGVARTQAIGRDGEQRQLIVIALAGVALRISDNRHGTEQFVVYHAIAGDDASIARQLGI